MMILSARFLFQSTHPVWDGTISQYEALDWASISIHPSRVGWGDRESYIILATGISIHPSRVGWDGGGETSWTLDDVFQSTHPVWDGTRDGQRNYGELGISIHPSRVGWDLMLCI